MGLLTSGECADWWAGAVQSKLSQVERWAESKGYGANTTAGFCLFWGTGSVNSAADILLIDNLRLGEGSGAASAGGTKWGILADLGRAAAFIPIAKAPSALTSTSVKAVGKTEQATGKVVRAMGDADRSAAKIASGSGDATEDGMTVMEKIWKFIDNDPNHAGKNYLQQVFRLEDDAADYGVCWAVALGQALRRSGRYFMKLDDIAKLLGISEKGADMYRAMERVRVTSLRQMSVLLDDMKVAHSTIELKGFQHMNYGLRETLEAAIPKNERGVLLFAVRWGDSGHMLYAARSKGAVHIFDRSGDTVKSLGDLERYYKGISKASMETLDAVIWIPDAKVARGFDQKTMGPLGALLIPIFFKTAVMGGSSN